MRFLFISLALGLGFAAGAHAQDYSSSEYSDPWCTHVDGSDCSYHTFRQCLEASSGVSMTCFPNPFLYQRSRPEAQDQADTYPR